ncbi:MAG: GNAT family N-acetyltransferase [Deinococcales bacterium]
MDPGDALRAAERSLLAHARRGRIHVEAGALLACLIPGEPEPFAHVAVPAGPEPSDWHASVAALLSLSGSQGRVPRLEFMQELHPGLPRALEAAGFRRDGSAAVMVTAERAAAPPRPLGSSLHLVDLAGATGATLDAFVTEQARAFGMKAATGRYFLGRLRDGLSEGVVAAVVLLEDGIPVSGATLLLADEAAELAGVWTAPERRRRGFAFAVCQALLEIAAQAGVTVWLSAADDVAGLYRDLGFRPVGTQLDYSLP